MNEQIPNPAPPESASPIAAYVAWLSQQSAHQAEWLKGALSHAMHNDLGSYESLGVSFHNRLLLPLLQEERTEVFPPDDSRRSFYSFEAERIRFPARETVRTRDGSALCMAVGASLRTSLVTNARVSSYSFSVPKALISLGSASSGHSDNLKEYGGRFFTELLDLYFAIFGRGNTLNEYFLDNVLGRQPYRQTVALSVRFDETNAQPLCWHHDPGMKGRALWSRWARVSRI